MKRLLLFFVLLSFSARAATVQEDLRAAQQLAWQKKFGEAEAVYRRVLAREPRSRAAALGLGQVLLWEQRYDDATRVYRELLDRASNDLDARRGLATAEYWSGDFRAAQRDYEAVLQARPNDEEARRALAEIANTTVPTFASGATLTSDDQPMQRTNVSASATFFSDPLTKWTASAGTYFLSARSLGFGSATAPFASIAGSTTFPSVRLRAGASLRTFRFPDGKTQPSGGISLSRGALTFEIDRHELLYTASSIDAHPSETVASLRWNRERDGASSAAAVHAIRYFDGNDGLAADAYHLMRIVRRGRASVSLGAATSYRDSDESRFGLIGASASARGAGTYAYSYEARYEPYWTPRELFEVRGIVAATVPIQRATLNLHADGGWAQDRDLVFGPSSGTSPLAPLFPLPIEVRRTFRPWRIAADFTMPLPNALALTIGAERQSTAFYRAITVHAGVSGRF
ncbi:MAG: tetratricopeptide repeat protein [Acidobacteriota bacterium]|nr:tetratricopeptide repeat protein [Acidobacteriota bacterium]